MKFFDPSDSKYLSSLNSWRLVLKWSITVSNLKLTCEFIYTTYCLSVAVSRSRSYSGSSWLFLTSSVILASSKKADIFLS